MILNATKLALVDVSMPTLEGDAVVWIARAHQVHASRIVLYSAKPAAELEQLVASSGADGFICKTSDEDALRRADSAAAGYWHTLTHAFATHFSVGEPASQSAGVGGASPAGQSLSSRHAPFLVHVL